MTNGSPCKIDFVFHPEKGTKIENPTLHNNPLSLSSSFHSAPPILHVSSSSDVVSSSESTVPFLCTAFNFVSPFRDGRSYLAVRGIAPG